MDPAGRLRRRTCHARSPQALWRVACPCTPGIHYYHAELCYQQHDDGPWCTQGAHHDSIRDGRDPPKPHRPHSRHQGPQNRPRSAPQREMGGRQHRDSKQVNVPGKEGTLEAPGFSKMDFNSDQRFAPQQNISSRMNIMTDFFGLGASKVPSFPRTLMYHTCTCHVRP